MKKKLVLIIGAAIVFVFAVAAGVGLGIQSNNDNQYRDISIVDNQDADGNQDAGAGNRD